MSQLLTFLKPNKLFYSSYLNIIYEKIVISNNKPFNHFFFSICINYYLTMLKVEKLIIRKKLAINGVPLSCMYIFVGI